MLRFPVLTLLPLTFTMMLPVTVPAAAHARIIHLYDLYWAAQTIDPSYNPALAPDQDGDGHADLEGQPNLTMAVDILADPAHPDHSALHDLFAANESHATNILEAKWPGQPLVTPLAALWALFMTIQGPGDFQGPTYTGMAGRIEDRWYMVETVAGPFNLDDWQKSPLFGAPAGYTATISVTNGGVAMEGDRVVFTAGPADALGYQWYKEGTAISAANAATFVLDPVQLADAGDYFCQLQLPAKTAIVDTPVVTLVVLQTPGVTASSLVPRALLLALLALLTVVHLPRRRRC
jgi:hypothetical protein